MEKERESKTIMNSKSPPDFLPHILSKLPFSHLPTCRLVCKAWNTCISSFKFESNHLIAQIAGHPLQCVNLDPKHLKVMNIVGSFKSLPTWSSSPTGIANTCNGLLCIFNAERVAVSNPMTNEYIELPKGVQHQRYVYGLGYSPKTKQYKIARHKFKQDELLIEILSLGTSLNDQDQDSQWRHVVRMSTTIEIFRHGTYFNGAIYWVGERGAIFCAGEKGVGERGEVFFGTSKQNVLWCLNVEDEKFEKLWLPIVGGRWNDTASCGVFNGKLYVSYYQMRDSEHHVWMMDGEGLWKKAFSVGIPHKFYAGLMSIQFFRFQLIKLCEDGKILCLVRSLILVLYDPEFGKLEKLELGEEFQKFFRILHLDFINFDSLSNILGGHDAAAA